MKLSTIKSAYISITILFLLSSCISNTPNEDNENIKRFNELLDSSTIDISNKKKLVYWAPNACEGCRNITINTLLNNPDINNNLKVIIPSKFNSKLSDLVDSKFIDSSNVFQNKYFGIGNVGIVYLEGDSVVKIKDFNTDEMDLFVHELIK